MKKNKLFYGWWIAFASFFLLLMQGIAGNCGSVFIKPVTDTLKVSRTEFSLHFTIVALSIVISASVIGKVIKKYGLRLVMLVSCVLLGIGHIGFSRANELIHFYLMDVLVGIGIAGATIIPASILITSWFEKKRGFIMGICFTASGLAGLIFNPLLNRIIMNYSWREAYLMMGVVILVLGIPVIYFIVVDHPSKKGLMPYGKEETQTNLNTEVTGLKLAEAMKTSYFWCLVIAVFLVNIQAGGVLVQLVPYLTDTGFSSTFATNIIAIAMGSLMIGKIAIGAIFDRFGSRVGVSYAIIIIMISMLVLMGAKTAPIAIIFGILVGLGSPIAAVAPSLLTAELFGNKDYGSIFGIVNMFCMLGTAIGPIVTSSIYDATGSYIAAWKLTIALVATALVLLLLSISRFKRANARKEVV